MTTNGQRVLNHEHSQLKDLWYLPIIWKYKWVFLLQQKFFLTNCTCMALLLLALLIETTIILTRGSFFALS